MVNPCSMAKAARWVSGTRLPVGRYRPISEPRTSVWRWVGTGTHAGAHASQAITWAHAKSAVSQRLREYSGAGGDAQERQEGVPGQPNPSRPVELSLQPLPRPGMKWAALVGGKRAKGWHRPGSRLGLRVPLGHHAEDLADVGQVNQGPHRVALLNEPLRGWRPFPKRLQATTALSKSSTPNSATSTSGSRKARVAMPGKPGAQASSTMPNSTAFGAVICLLETAASCSTSQSLPASPATKATSAEVSTTRPLKPAGRARRIP